MLYLLSTGGSFLHSARISFITRRYSAFNLLCRRATSRYLPSIKPWHAIPAFNISFILIVESSVSVSHRNGPPSHDSSLAQRPRSIPTPHPHYLAGDACRSLPYKSGTASARWRDPSAGDRAREPRGRKPWNNPRHAWIGAGRYLGESPRRRVRICHVEGWVRHLQLFPGPIPEQPDSDEGAEAILGQLKCPGI